MEKLKTFLGSVWFVGLTIVVAGLMIGLKEDMDIAMFFGMIFILWCGIPGGILLIIDEVQSSRYKKEQEEHNRKYITEEIIEDDFFGRMRGRHHEKISEDAAIFITLDMGIHLCCRTHRRTGGN